MKLLKLLSASASIQLETYLKNSAIAGQKFLVRGVERTGISCVWRLLLNGSVVVALMIIMNLWDTFRQNPRFTVLDLNTHGVPLNFPSVFVCPKLAVNKDALGSLVKNTIALNNMTAKHKKIQSCIESLLTMHISDAEILKRCRPYEDFLKLPGLESQVMNTMYTVEQALRNCSYKGETMPCDKYFKSFFTEIGYCYVLNNINVNMAYLSEESDTSKNKKMILNEFDRDWSLRFSMRLFKGTAKVYFKDTNDILSFYDRPEVQWDQFSDPSIKLKITDNYCTDSVRVLSVSQRGCLFNDDPFEYPFDIKREYNEHVCANVCHAQLFYKSCQCASRSYKMLIPNIPYPLCSLKDLLCYVENRRVISRDKCVYCLKNCNFFQYDIQHEIQEADNYVMKSNVFRPNKTRTNKVKPLPGENITYHPFIIDLSDWPMYRYKTSIIFGLTELIVSLGGVAGLILGCSFVTCVEILYYASMRLCCALRTNKQEILDKMEEQEKEDPPLINLSLKPC